MILLLIGADALLHGKVFALVTDSSRHASPQEDALVVRQLLGSQVDREQRFRLVDGQADKHDLFSLQIRVRDVQMHQTGVSREHCSNLDREFV